MALTAWTKARKLEAAIESPFGPGLHAADTRVLDRPGWRQIVTPSAAGGVMNEVGYSVITEGDVEAVIDDVIATYKACGQPVKWYVGPWTKPDDFGERLERRGFSWTAMRGMGADTAMQIETPSDVSVREVTDDASLHELLDVSARGWSMTKADLDPAMYRAALMKRPQIVRFFSAFIDGVAVGSACLIVRDDYGYLMGTQVLEHARGRGAYKAMVAARLAWLRAQGLEYAVIQAREATAAPILSHLGFEDLFESRCYRLST
jgi:hypothetical protein